MQRFTVKSTLTKMVNKDGWTIYRDSENGMYAKNDVLGIEFPLNCWNLTLNNPDLERQIEWIRKDIEAEELNAKIEEDDFCNACSRLAKKLSKFF